MAMVAGVFGFIGLQVYDSAPASALDMKYTNIGTHPRAAALIGTSYDYYGPRLEDMAISNGKLYAGYGDWNSNSDSWGPAEGRVALVPFDIASRTFESQNEIMVGSESINNIREINGSLYIPSIDPSIHGSGGYTTNESGTWQVRNVVPDAVHVFDVATLDGDDLWLFGARDNYPPFDGSVGRAIAWRSTDGGQSWTEEITQGSEPGQGAGFERYYWGQKAGSRMFMHAAGTVPELPTRSSDGTNTADHSNITCGANGHRVTEFAGKIVCPNSYIDQQYHNLIAINSDGSAAPVNYDSNGYIEDFYIDNGYLYVLENDGTVQRTNDLQTWTALGSWSYPGQDYVTATSIAVYNDKIYIGDSRANIYESGTTMTDELSISGVETCFMFDGNGTITGYYEHENDNAQNPECSKDVVIPGEIEGEPVTAIGQYAFESKGIESVEIPETVTLIDRYAFSYNSLSSVDLPVGLQSISYGAFSDNQIETIQIPTNVTTVDSRAFANNLLQSISIPSSLTSLSEEIFFGNMLTSVSIPSTITSIGAYAFAGNLLTSLTIPSSVTTIGEGAFESNELRTVTLPNGLTEIMPYVFAANRLKQVTIPSNVTSIADTSFMEQTELRLPMNDEQNIDIKADVTSQDEDAVAVNLQQYLDSIWYVRLYTQDPSNPNGLMSGAWVEHIDETECDQVDIDSVDRMSMRDCGGGTNYQAAFCPEIPAARVGSTATTFASCNGDQNGDGDADDIFDANYGGHLINPAFVALKSETTDGDELSEPRTLSGKDGERYVEGYMVKNGPVLAPTPIDSRDDEVIPFGGVGVLAADDPNTIELSESYYRVGQTIQVPASFFPGYSLASGDTLVSITLTAAVNEYTFVYELTDPSLIPGTPNTGGGVVLSIGAVLAVLITALVGTIYVRSRHKSATI